MIDYSLLETRLSRCAFGHTVHFYARCPTTQDIAHGLAATNAHGTLVVAETQTAGRGRHGRRWQTARGGSIATSFLLKPPRSLPPDAPCPSWPRSPCGTPCSDRRRSWRLPCG